MIEEGAWDEAHKIRDLWNASKEPEEIAKKIGQRGSSGKWKHDAALEKGGLKLRSINLESFLTVKKELLDAPKVDKITVKSRNSKLTVNLELLDARKLDFFFKTQSRLQSTKPRRLLA